MSSICLSTAASITGLSKRTLWRYIESGRLSAIGAAEPGGATRVRLDDILPFSHIPLTTDDPALILAADAGDAAARCCLALLFFTARGPADAVHWLTLAAKQFYPDAMCYLGRCYLSGEGVTRDEDAGILWLSQAAAKGYPLAQHLMGFLQSQPGQRLLKANEPEGLDAALDDVERKVLLKALVDMGQPQGVDETSP